MTTTPAWGPFHNYAEARRRLGSFVDATLAPDIGIAWVANGALTPIRMPVYDSGGYGTLVIVEWHEMPPFPVRPRGLGERIEAWVIRALAEQGRQQLRNSEMALNASNMMAGALRPVFQPLFGQGRAADTAGVALDALAVGLSVGFASGILAYVAVGGAAILLLTDGLAWGTELAGSDDIAENVRRSTDPIRWIAIAASLPDFAWNGARAIREIGEVRRASCPGARRPPPAP